MARPAKKERKPCMKCGRPRPTKEHVDDNVNHPLGCACERCMAVCWGDKAGCEENAHLRLVAIETGLEQLQKAVAEVERMVDLLWNAPPSRARAAKRRVRR